MNVIRSAWARKGSLRILSLFCAAVMLIAALPTVWSLAEVSSDTSKTYHMQTLAYNRDVFAFSANKTDGNFDGGGALFAADELPAEPVYDGVPYRYGPMEDGAYNAVRAIDTTSNMDIPVTRGYYDTVHLLMARCNGGGTVKLWLCFTDGTRQEAQLELPDWTSENTEGIVYQAYRYANGEIDNSKATIRHYQVDVVEENRNKVLKTISIEGLSAAENNHLFAVTLYGVQEENASFYPLDLPYNVDMFAKDGNKTDYNDGKEDDGSAKFEWEVFSAEGLDASQTFAGVPYTLGSFADGDNNAIRTDRALPVTIDVEAGYYQDINFLYASSGNPEISLYLYFEDGTVQQASLGDFDDNGVIKTRDWSWGDYANAIAMRVPVYQGGNSSSETKIIRTGAIDISAENQEKVLVGMRMVGLHNEKAWIFAATAYGVPATAPGDFVTVELPFNSDGFSTATSKDDGGHVEDGGAVTLSADTIGDSNRTLLGVPYKMGGFADGQKNLLKNKDGATVQFIPVARGSYRQAYFMALSTGGDNEMAIAFHYTDGTVSNGTYVVKDWFNTSGTDVADKVLMYENGNENNCGLATRMFRLPVDDTKTLSYISMSSTVLQKAGNVMLAAVTLQGKAGAQQQFVQMTELAYNTDMFATSQNKSDYTSYLDTVLSADNVSKEQIVNGVPYTFGSFEDGKDNAITVPHGQDTVIQVTTGYYSELHLLHTVYGGDLRVDVVLNYEDGTTQEARLGAEYDHDGGKIYDWANMGASPETLAMTVPCWNTSGDDYGVRGIRFTAVYPDPTKKLVSVTLVDDGEEYKEPAVFAVTAYGTVAEVEDEEDNEDETPPTSEYVVMDALAYNVDMFATSQNKSDYTSYLDTVFSADNMSKGHVINGVPYTFGPFEDGKSNVIASSHGQDTVIQVTAGHYSELHLLHTVYGGDLRVNVVLNYEDGTTQETRLGAEYDYDGGKVYDWATLDASPETLAMTVPCWNTAGEYYGARGIRFTTLHPDSTKKLVSITLVDDGEQYKDTVIFAMTAYGVAETPPAGDYVVMDELAYNTDMFAGSQNKSDYSSYLDTVFSADDVAKEQTVNGVPYTFGPFEDGKSNVITSTHGQNTVIQVTAGYYHKVHLLHTVYGGDLRVNVVLTYEDGTTQETRLGAEYDYDGGKVYDWATLDASPETLAMTVPCWNTAGENYGMRSIRFTTLQPVSVKKLVSITLVDDGEPYKDTAVFAVTAYGTAAETDEDKEEDKGEDKEDTPIDDKYVVMDTLAYNTDVFATSKNKGDFSSYLDTVFSADDLAKKQTINGVPYAFGPFEDGKSNVITSSHGQNTVIRVKAGYYSQLNLLHTVYGGDLRVDVVLNYEDGTTQKARLGAEYDHDGGKIYDWAVLDAAPETLAMTVPCWNAAGENYGARSIRFTALQPKATKKLVSITLVDDGEQYKDAIIFAITAYGVAIAPFSSDYVMMDKLGYNTDVFATSKNKSDFTSYLDTVFSADDLTRGQAVNGVSYTFGPFKDGKANAITTSHGQNTVIPLTAGYYSDLHLLHTVYGGDLRVDVVLNYEDGTTQEARLGAEYDHDGGKVYDWAALDAAPETLAMSVPCWNAAGEDYGMRGIRFTTLHPVPAKKLVSITLLDDGEQYKDAIIFAITAYGVAETPPAGDYVVMDKLAYNADMFATSKNKSDFTSYLDTVFSADGLAKKQTVNEVPYAFGSFKDGKSNVILSSHGRDTVIPLTAGYYSKLHLLHTVYGGDLRVNVVLTYEDGTTQEARLGAEYDYDGGKIYDWANMGASPETLAMTVPCWNAAGEDYGARGIRFTAVHPVSVKKLVSITLLDDGEQYKDAVIFAVTAYGTVAEEEDEEEKSSDGEYVVMDTLAYNTDMFATSKNKGDFSSYLDTVFSADDLAKKQTINGVPYKFGSFEDGKANVITTSHGQNTVIRVKEGYYSQLHLLHTVYGGDLRVDVVLNYADGTTQEARLGAEYDHDGGKVYDWAILDAAPETLAMNVPCWNAAGEDYGARSIRFTAVQSDDTKKLLSITLVDDGEQYKDAIVFAVTAYGMQEKPLDGDYVVMNALTYNTDMFATSQNKSDFTAYLDTVFSADDVAKGQNVNGVPYTFGPFEDGKSNVITSSHGRDTVIPLTVGQYSQLHLLHTVYGGDLRVNVVLTYEDGTTQEARLGAEYDYDGGKIYDWATMDAAPETLAMTVPCWNAAGEYYGSRGIRFTTVYPISAKKLVSITLVDDGEQYRDAVIFAITAYGVAEKPLDGDYVVMDELTYTDDVFSFSENKQDGAFDVGGAVFPADGLKQTVKYGNVPFKFGSFEDGEKNAIRAIETLDVHTEVVRGYYSKLYVLYSIYNGNHEVCLDLIYSDGSEERVSLGVAYDWTYLGSDAPAVLAQPYRYEKTDSGYVKVATPVHVYAGEVPVNPEKELRTVRVPGDAPDSTLIMGLTAFGEKSANQRPVTYYTGMLSLPYNFDAFSTANAIDGNFDGGRASFPADGLSQDISFAGIPFRFGSFESGANNGIRTVGDDVKVKIAAGRYETLYFVYSMAGVTKEGRDFCVKLLFADGTEQETILARGTDWTYGGAHNVAVSQPYRYVPGAADFDGRPLKNTKENMQVNLFASSVRIDEKNRDKSLVAVMLSSDQMNNFIFAITGYGTQYVKVSDSSQQTVGNQGENTQTPDDTAEQIDDSDQIITGGPADEQKPTASPKDKDGGVLVWILVAIVVLVLAALIVLFVYKRKVSRTTKAAVPSKDKETEAKP